MKSILEMPANELILKDGQAVFDRGAESDGMYFIYAGAVEFHHHIANKARGETKVDPLLVMTPGECFGEGALLSGKPRALAAVARGTTILRLLPRQQLDKILPFHPDLRSQLRDLGRSTSQELLLRRRAMITSTCGTPQKRIRRNTPTLRTSTCVRLRRWTARSGWQPSTMPVPIRPLFLPLSIYIDLGDSM